MTDLEQQICEVLTMESSDFFEICAVLKLDPKKDFAYGNCQGITIALGSDMTDADLRGCNLRDAILRGINFDGADFTGADLTGADTSGSSFKGAIGLDTLTTEI